MVKPISLTREWRGTLIAAGGMVIVSSLAFAILSRVGEGIAGGTLGVISTVLLAGWLLMQLWTYVVRIGQPKHQVVLMGISFIQSVPFLYAAVYSSFGYSDSCVLGADRSSEFLYFSYVTFTTVGYGDLQPVGMCRGLAVAEAVTGYILLGLFVSAAVAVASYERHSKT
ncbi:potassium channel family protein [Ruegeria marina]|uniref:Ion channel n=1 Tax=Ruegeria marina TaxID=639004 RepID=A0A1G7ACX4_9RHOB|nr:potassium channel family protein [Ruegeria marina]SDE12327.1 Ion channel [Ruegeria marina]